MTRCNWVQTLTQSSGTREQDQRSFSPFTSAMGSQGCKTACVAAVPAYVQSLHPSSWCFYPLELPEFES